MSDRFILALETGEAGRLWRAGVAYRGRPLGSFCMIPLRWPISEFNATESAVPIPNSACDTTVQY